MTDLSARLAAELAACEAATDGPWEITQGSPTMAGDTWTLRIAGKSGIRIQATEYQHGTGNSDFIATARTGYPAALRALQAVMELHRKSPNTRWYGFPRADKEEHYCKKDSESWPCSTVRALEGALRDE